MDFDTVAGELYGGDLAEFVSARNAAAKAAKAEGNAELAAKIRELRKPTTAAAIVNRLAREDDAELRELAELGDELRDAHTRLAGDDLRALTRRRGELVRRIVHGLPSMSDTVSREVEATLEAVAADPGTAELAVAGRLTSVAHQDTDQWFTLAANAAPPSAGKRPAKLVEKAEPAKPKRDHRREEEERRQARAERERLRKEAAELAKERAVAERDLVRTERAAEQATARVEDLRTRLEEAEERAERATAEFEKAKETYEQADNAAEEARKAAEAR
ncbi:Uncharacterised protein [Amycolatopsis camponoti]|uniref:Uncharacterized protein n=1 Tax=Amycolatopsis camponoti TaxID=2606593 RepID=A0A6I8LLE7_9PSEU|nr:hypothetical protein [Amycolatopsis camponoti]VVJ15999.1 Uncharacterised protein [Amycolatopsis camponoti]